MDKAYCCDEANGGDYSADKKEWFKLESRYV
jgi:hypothetical protein